MFVGLFFLKDLYAPEQNSHDGNKYPTDLETYFQNGNHFHLIWIPIQRKFPNQLETVSKPNGNRSHFGNMFPDQMETVSILKIVSKQNGNLCFHFEI